MKPNYQRLSRRYLAALRIHMKHSRRASADVARRLGSEALGAGLQTLDLAKIHEQTLVLDLLPSCPPARHTSLVKKAAAYFSAAIIPIKETHCSALENSIQLKRIVEMLSKRTVELAASNLELSLEITHRKAVEEALKKSERHYLNLLEQSDRLQAQLRRMSRQILSAQEDERKGSAGNFTMSSPRHLRGSIFDWLL